MGDIGTDITNTLDSLTSTAVPAVIAGAENYAATQLTQSASASTAQATAAAKAAVANGTPATGILASIEQSLTGIGTSLGLGAYGGYIVLGVVAIIAGTLYVKSL